MTEEEEKEKENRRRKRSRTKTIRETKQEKHNDYKRKNVFTLHKAKKGGKRAVHEEV